MPIMTPESHKTFLQLVVPQQLQQSFNVKPIPREISCFITTILQQLPDTQQQSPKQKPSELALGNVGTLSSIALGSHKFTWMECQGTNKTL